MRIFAARAASILIYDVDAHELVFEAAAGRGPGGARRAAASAAGSGIMGWVLSSQEPMIIDDVTRDPRFDREGAERLGYVPKHMMSVPLLHDEEALGVLNVLDRRERSFSSVEEMDLLGTLREPGVDRDLGRARRQARQADARGRRRATAPSSPASPRRSTRSRVRKRAAATQLLEALDAS